MLVELTADQVGLLNMADAYGDPDFQAMALDLCSLSLGRPAEPRPVIARDDTGAITGLAYPA